MEKHNPAPQAIDDSELDEVTGGFGIRWYECEKCLHPYRSKDYKKYKGLCPVCGGKLIIIK